MPDNMWMMLLDEALLCKPGELYSDIVLNQSPVCVGELETTVNL